MIFNLYREKCVTGKDQVRLAHGFRTLSPLLPDLLILVPFTGVLNSALPCLELGLVLMPQGLCDPNFGTQILADVMY